MDFQRIRLGANTGYIDLIMQHSVSPVKNASSGPYLLKQVDGLGPTPIDVNIAGGKYRGRTAQPRQIISRIGLLPNYATNQKASDLRDELYGLLTNPHGVDTNDVPIDFMRYDGPGGWTIVATTTGYASKFEIVPFSKDPEVQVTFECASAFLDGGEFESRSPEIGSVLPAFTNPGTAESGFVLTLKFESVVPSFKITHTDTGKFMEIVYPFTSSKILKIDTREGSRGVWVINESNVETNIIYALTADSTWLTLFNGENAFLVSSTEFNWADFQPGFFWRPQYWGV